MNIIVNNANLVFVKSNNPLVLFDQESPNEYYIADKFFGVFHSGATVAPANIANGACVSMLPVEGGTKIKIECDAASYDSSTSAYTANVGTNCYFYLVDSELNALNHWDYNNSYPTGLFHPMNMFKNTSRGVQHETTITLPNNTAYLCFTLKDGTGNVVDGQVSGVKITKVPD